MESLSDKSYICVFCDKTFEDKFELIYHKEKCDQRHNTICKKCGMPFQYPYELKRHLKKKISCNAGDSEDKKYVCIKCYKVFKDNQGYHRHLKRKTPCDVKIHVLKSYECGKCGKIFNDKFDYTRHTQRVTPCNISIKKRNHKCERCHKVFKSSRNYRYHIRRQKPCIVIDDDSNVVSDDIDNDNIDIIDEHLLNINKLIKETEFPTYIKLPYYPSLPHFNW